MCGKGFIPNLMFQGKRANQALSPAGGKRVHWDRELCRQLENFEEKRNDRAAFVPKGIDGSDRLVGEPADTHPVDTVGLGRSDDAERTHLGTDEDRGDSA
jgi:hypothetical protein